MRNTAMQPTTNPMLKQIMPAQQIHAMRGLP
jgi:hypothetical protein